MKFSSQEQMISFLNDWQKDYADTDVPDVIAAIFDQFTDKLAAEKRDSFDDGYEQGFDDALYDDNYVDQGAIAFQVLSRYF